MFIARIRNTSVDVKEIKVAILKLLYISLLCSITDARKWQQE